MERRTYLQIPGPTNIPDRILRSLSQPLINHRGPEFGELLTKCVEGLKKVYKTKNDILIFPSSGSGVIESAIVNLFSPGDTILTASIGVFSERAATIAEKFGLNVIRITKEWGESVKPEDVKKVLEEDTDKKIKGVFVPHNETTAAVASDIKGISEVIKEINHPAVLIIDAVSSLACLPIETDDWAIDIVLTGSQKGLMLPPGMGIVSISPKAWELVEKSTLPKWYWSYKAVKERMEIKEFPYTPATTLLFGLSEALDIIEEEGLENVIARHELLATAVREAAKAMGLSIFTEEGYESNSVTAIIMPEGISYKDLAGILKTKFGVVVGGGLQKLKGKILRIGHLGSIHKADIYAIMCAVEAALFELGYKVELGSAARAVSKVFLNDK
ncbi:MAG TPA: alanine--glyoxylate aminotransferase family protein [Bacillota bacterium]|nr:alanine--glyoxylate aminotransferase family protein [Clostridiaceae bacterium]HNR03230.1 alanine--glyoxylate aminotransferase family protein [Bacillota bacterium]HNT02969.1 alanine--glyoxylate aminotransferase family protein [Bacillota bacterium]HPX67775.1 alanine--glyoxylate aminotransferase family protein [Bacillota bacterium]HQA64320.1 alanine--glyoxylate aminotransferase family protein [Bacillota bacterium]